MLQYSGIDVPLVLGAKAPLQGWQRLLFKKTRDFAIAQSPRSLQGSRVSSLLTFKLSSYAKPAKTIALNFKPGPVQSRIVARSDVLSTRDETRQTSLFVVFRARRSTLSVSLEVFNCEHAIKEG
jgi:hypothetical protein